MQFLFFLSTILLTGVVSSVVTVFLLRRYILGFGLGERSMITQINKKEHTQGIKENPILIESRKTVSIGNFFTKILYFVKNAVVILFYYLSRLVCKINGIFKFVLVAFARVTTSLYEYAAILVDVLMSLPLVGIMYVYKDSIKKIKRVAYYLYAMLKRLASIPFRLWRFTKNIFSNIKNTTLDLNFFKAKKIANQIDPTESLKPIEEIAVKEHLLEHDILNQKSFKKEALRARPGRYHFLFEALASVLFAALILAPFISKVQQTTPGYFFFYHTAVLIFGSYILLKHHSPRIFWAIGILEWVSVFFWFFNWYGAQYLLEASIFLTIFVLIYGFSSYKWYGLEGHEYTYIEYALFVLHPFLYMSAIYLLLVGGYKYVVSMLFISIAAVYGYFAKSLYINNKTKKLFYICLVVSTIATLSFLAIVFSGLLLLLTLTLLAISILSLSNHYQMRTTLYVLPVLVYLTGYALSSISPLEKYVFLFNTRFLSYVVSSATLIFVSMYLRRIYNKNIQQVYRYSYSIVLLVATILISVGVTLEILDIKEYSLILKNISTPVFLTSFYIIYAILLYVLGKKYSLRTLSLASICISIYAVIYCLRTFLF